MQTHGYGLTSGHSKDECESDFSYVGRKRHRKFSTAATATYKQAEQAEQHWSTTGHIYSQSFVAGTMIWTRLVGDR